MKDKKMTRRGAMARLAKIVAMAAGLSTMQVRRLFGLERTTTKELKPVQKTTPVQKAIQKSPNLQKLQAVKPSNKAVKILKVFMHPERSVFESEFGRVTPEYKVTDVTRIPENYRQILESFDVRPGAIVCEMEWMGPGDFVKCDVGLFCGMNIIDGGVVVGADCNDNCHLGCDPGKLICKNKCGPQTSCGPSNYQEWPDEYTSASFFDRFKTDPYIQTLFREFNVTTSSELAREVQTMIMQQRQGVGR